MTTIRPDLIERLQQITDYQSIDPNQLLEIVLNQHERNRTLMGITLDAVIIVDTTQKILEFNSEAEVIFGYQAEEVIGQTIDILLPERFHNSHRQHIQQFSTSADNKRLMNHRQKIYGKRKDGTHFPAEASIAKSGDNNHLQLYVFLRDITEHALVQEELQESEQYLNLLMDNINDLICLHEADGRYKFVSSSISAIAGYEVEELIGKNPYDFFHVDDRDAIRKSHEAVLNTQAISATTYRFKHKDGHYIWFETNTQTIFDEHDNVIHLVTSTRDVTEKIHIQEQLRQERDILEKIMDTSPSGIIVVDKSGEIEFSNRRAEKILRLRKSEQLERSYDSQEWKHTHYDGTPWPDEKQPFVQVMKTRQPVYNVQHAIESPEGQRVLLSINGAPLFDEQGEISKVVFTVEDVTELKRAEQSLQESLEKEQGINNLKSRFLSIVSHEFRTPLSVILTSTDLLEHRLSNQLNENILKRLDQIRRQIKYLDTQLDEISTFNKSNHSQIELNLEQTFVVDLLHQLIMEESSRHNAYPPIHVITSHNRNESFLLDPQLIQHIFSNLIANAIKYSKEQGEISVTLSCTEEQLKFQIRDEGIGIADEDQDKLFNFFYRGNNVGGIHGTGIGLAVVKQSVTAHGGEIDFTSEVGVGSIFNVTIPIQSAPSK